MFNINKGMLSLSVLATVTILIGTAFADMTPGFKRAMEVQDAHTHDLMLDPEVVGTAVGLNKGGDR